MGFRIPINKSQENTIVNTPAETLEAPPVVSTENVITPPGNTDPALGMNQPYREPATNPAPPDDVEGIPADIYNRVIGAQDTTAAAGVEGVPEDVYNKVMKNPAPSADPLYQSKVLARKVDPVQSKNILDISERLKISADEAQAMLSTRSHEELKAIPELKDIDKDYPGVTTWARNPNNLKLLQKDPAWAKKIEARNGVLKEGLWDDAKRVAKQSYSTMKQQMLHIQVANGLKDPRKAAAEMAKLQDEIDQNPFVAYKRQVERVNRSYENLGNRLDKAEEMSKAASKLSIEDRESLFKWSMMKAKQYGITADAALDYAAEVVKNPGAALLLSENSVAQMAPGVVGGLTGGVVAPTIAAGSILATGGASLPVVAGAMALSSTVGAAGGGYVGGFIPAYGGKLVELSEQYRNPKTGKIDFEEMYSDPVALKKIKSIALKYAGTHAVFDAVQAGIAGKTVGPILEEIQASGKAASGIAKAAKVGGALAGESVVNAGLEGTGEAAALLASGSSAKDAKQQAIQEFVFALPMAGGEVVAHTMVDRLVQRGSMGSISKLSEMKAKATDAVEKMNVVKSNREDKGRSEIPRNYPQQAQELVNSSFPQNPVKPDQVPDRPNFVQFNVREFEAEAYNLGRDPVEVAQAMGPNFIETYTNAKQSDAPEFQIGYDEYYRYNDDFPELDEIIQVNAAEMTAREGQNTLEEIYKNQDRLLNLNDLPTSNIEGEGNEDGTPPPITNDMLDSDTSFFETGEPQEGDPVLRPIQLLQTGRSGAEREVFRGLRNAITRSTKAAGIDPELGDVMAEIQFRNTRFRAEQLGLPIKDVADQTRIGFQKSLDSSSRDSLAYFKPGSDAQGMPRSRVIFGSKVKPNAIVHEFAHSWLHNMAVDFNYINGLKERTQNQQEYFEAMTTAADLLGLKDIGELLETPAANYKKIHETWAQTAEKYFLEGEFKDSKIRAVFEKMRKWMASVASIVGRSYPQFPSLELSPEVSRVFQTILEGNRAVEENMQQMFPEPLFNPEMLGARAPEYQKAIADSRDQAVGQMYSKFFRRSDKEREVLINQNLNSIYDEANTQVEDRPSIVLMRAIQGTENPISYQSIVDALANGDEARAEAIRALAPKGIIAAKKKAGIDVRSIMQEMNIYDPIEMISMIQEMGERDQMVDTLAGRIIDERFPILKSDEDIHNEAVQAIHNQGREKVLQMELEVLADQHLATLQKMGGVVAMPPDMMNRKALINIKEQAYKTVANSRAMQMRPDDFLKASSRHGKRAADFLARGDFENAFWEKQQEAVNFHSYKEAREQFIQVNKTTAQIKRMLAPKERSFWKQNDADLYEYGQLAIRALNANQPIPKIDIDTFTNKMFIDHSRMNIINASVDAINNSLVGKTAANITVEAYNEFGDMLNKVRASARLTKWVQLQDFNMSVEGAGMLTAAEMGPRRQGDPTVSMAKGGTIISRWNAGLINMRTLFAGMMDEAAWANSDMSKMLQSAFEAENVFNTNKNQDEQALAVAVENITKNNPEMQGLMSAVSKRYELMFKGDIGKPIAAKELEFNFANEGELHQFMLYMGSESGRIKVGTGGLRRKDGTTTGPLGAFHPESGIFQMPEVDKMIQRMVDERILRKEHFDFYQTVWDIYARHYDPLKDAMKRVYGQTIGEIQPKTIQTPFGDYRGGYVPLARDKAYVEANMNLSDFTVDNPHTPVADLVPMVSKGMTQKRTGEKYPVSLDLGSLRSNLNSVYRASYLMPTMFEIGKIMSTDDFKSTLDARRPGAMQAIVIPWFKRTMAQEYSVTPDTPSDRAISGVARWLRRETRVVSFIGNYATVMKQYLGVFPAGAIVGQRKILRAAAEVGVRPSNFISSIADQSPRMKQRFADNERRAVRSFEEFALNTDKLEMLNQKVEKLTYGPIQWAQNHVDAVVFTAAVDHGRMLGLQDKALYNYAADVVERSQMSSNISSRPDIMHGSEAKRLFTDFASVPLAMYGILNEAKMRSADESTAKRAAIQLYTLMQIAAVPATFGFMIANPGKMARTLGDEEEPEEYLKDMAINSLRETGEIVFPVAGRNVLSLFDKNSQGGVMPATRTGKIMAGAATAGFQRVNPLSEKTELTSRDVRNMLDTATIVTGIPFSVLSRGFKTLIDLFPEIDPDN